MTVLTIITKIWVVRATKDVSFYEYMDSKEIFNKVKNNHIKSSEVKNKQNNFLKKLNEVKVDKKKWQTKRSDR